MKLRWIERREPAFEYGKGMFKMVKILQFYDCTNLNGQEHWGWQDVPTEQQEQ